MRAWLALVLILPLAGCVTPVAEDAYGRIDGAVLDQLMNPFANATVTVDGTEAQDATNDLGGFSLFVPAGVHTIRVSIAGVGDDTQRLAVVAGMTSRIILQVTREAPGHDFTTHLGHEGRDAFGLPGTECLACAWDAELGERRPDHVRLRATWDNQEFASKTAAPTFAIVELRDENGHLLATMEGTTPLEARLMGASIPPSADMLHVRVVMHPENQVPHPGVEVLTTLDLHYGTDL